MALDDDIRILSGVAFFEGFAPEQLRLLAFGAERVRLEGGALLYSEGEKADCAFMLLEGALELFTQADGRRSAVGRVQPGSLLGPLALIAGTPRPTSAAATGASLLLRIARKDFRRVLEEYPELAALLQGRIAAEFQAMVEGIGRLAPRFS